MDGIITGLTSIIPIIPDNSIIIEKGGIHVPPLEIMPLPTNSFSSESATTELLNNSFNLSLHDNTNNGTSVAPPIAEVPDEASLEGLLNDAYKLSLGDKEEVRLSPVADYEMARAKNYELLGRNATRHVYRFNTDTGAAEIVEPQLTANEANGFISDKVRNLLSQSALQQSELGVPFTLDSEVNIELLPRTVETTGKGYMVSREQSLFDSPPTMPSTMPPTTPPATQPATQQQTAPPAILTGAVQLSASDYKMIMELEPELREVFINMLAGENTMLLTTAEETPNTANVGTKAPVMQELGVEPKTIIISSSNTQSQPQPAATEQAKINLVGLPNTPMTDRLPGFLDWRVPLATEAVPTQFVTKDVLARLATTAFIDGATREVAMPATFSGNMANLSKINELPFSLYVFGNLAEKKRLPLEEDEDVPVADSNKAGKVNPMEYLKLSEAVKTAAVLHNIYYGGSGQLELETPWYAPYVRYALENGIIQNKDFEDFNTYATRREAAYIFSKCLPRTEFQQVNTVPLLPDVEETTGFGDGIYLLFRAGVLTHVNKNGFFFPELLMTKKEATEIVGRIATPHDRKRF